MNRRRHIYPHIGKSATFMLCLLFLACSNRKDYIVKLDSKPSISLRYGGKLYKNYQDSIKLRADLKNYAAIDLTFAGSDGISALRYSHDTLSGQLLYKNQPVSGELLNPENGETILKYSPKEEGTQVFKFIVTDRFNGSDTATLSVLCFKNLPPVASFSIEPIKIEDPLEYNLNASQSYDMDRHFGGNISSYTFNIQGQTFVSKTPTIKYIFPSTGKYEISLQVVDSDGASSQTYSQSFLVN